MFWKNHDRKPVPIEARFEPQPDITVYELAVIVSKTMAQPVKFEWGIWETIDPAIRRHFK